MSEDNKNTANNDFLKKLLSRIPKNYRARFMELVSMTMAFCNDYLDAEYKDLCLKMTIAVCQKGSPVLTGKAEGWAAGILHALGRVNFLHDPTQTPHVKVSEIANYFGVAISTMKNKEKIIRDGLDLMPFHPDWCLPSLVDDNPLIWMQMVKGFIIDIRNAPREIQVEAYEQGMIPYIPADRQEATEEEEED